MVMSDDRKSQPRVVAGYPDRTVNPHGRFLTWLYSSGTSPSEKSLTRHVKMTPQDVILTSKRPTFWSYQSKWRQNDVILTDAFLTGASLHASMSNVFRYVMSVSINRRFCGQINIVSTFKINVFPMTKSTLVRRRFDHSFLTEVCWSEGKLVGRPQSWSLLC